MENPAFGKTIEQKEDLEYDPQMVALAEKHLEIIGESLRDLMNRIVKEQPDCLVFMDKGARVFATPVKKYLQGLNLSKVPEIKYHNNDTLMDSYILDELDEEDFRKNFQEFQGEKVFFIDDTYSTGKSANILKKAKDFLNLDLSFFALTRDEFPLGVAGEYHVRRGKWNIEYDDFMATQEAVSRDEDFVIYHNNIQLLFSKEMGEKYLADVYDEEGNVITMHQGRKSKLPADYPREEESEINRVNEKEKRKRFKTVSIVKDLIYGVEGSNYSHLILLLN